MTDVVASVQAQIAGIQEEVGALQSAAALAPTDPSAFLTALSAAQANLAMPGAPGSQLGDLSSSGAGGGGGQVSGADVVATAEQYLGIPYVWGGSSPTGVDCSGLVQMVFSDLGVSVPRGSDAQSQTGQQVPSLSAAQPGDLLFFNSDGDQTGHVGIYLGNGQMIDAAHTGTSVRIEQVWSSLTSIRRVVPSAASSGIGTDANYVNSSGGSGGLLGVIPNSPEAIVANATGFGSVPGSGSSSLGSSVASSAGGASGAGGSVPPNLVPLFMSAATRYGVPPQLLAAVAQVESGFDPNAVSPAGAQGIMQIMPSTAAGIGVNPMDPAQAIDGAAQILASNISQFGSIPLALAAYNAGAGAVEQYGGIPPYAETQNYVNDVMGIYDGAGSGVSA